LLIRSWDKRINASGRDVIVRNTGLEGYEIFKDASFYLDLFVVFSVVFCWFGTIELRFENRKTTAGPSTPFATLRSFRMTNLWLCLFGDVFGHAIVWAGSMNAD
jgi:hypothetical protein